MYTLFFWSLSCFCALYHMGELDCFFRRCFSLYFDFQLPFGIGRPFHRGSGERWIISVIGFNVTISLIIVFPAVRPRHC